MLISLRSDHRDHLALLNTQPPEVILDFCKLALGFLQQGANLKLYSTAAEKLAVQPETIQNCVYGLVNLLLIGCKHELSEADFRDSVLTLGFNQEQQGVLSKFYESKKGDLAQIIAKLGVNEPHYDNLEWRFELQVASRSLLHQVTPLMTLDLGLKTLNSDTATYNKEHRVLQTDLTNLVHITHELEKALQESRSRHSRKMQRALNN